MNTIKKILTVCDTVSGCDTLAQEAGRFALQLDAELHLLAVIYNPFGVMGLSFPRPSLQGDYRKLLEKTGQELQLIVTRERHRGLRAYSLIREEKPVNAILEVIREKGIDLLVMPAHQQTWLESKVSEKNNRKLLRRMPCSILYLKIEPRAVEKEEEEEVEGTEEMAA
jgi:nucleotide-binding universal stress UspA family protein